MTGVEIVVESHSVSLLPADHPERHYFEVTIERRPGGRWVVQRGEKRFLDADGQWGWGSDCTDEWRQAHWHTWDDAVRLASAAAAELTVNGRAVADVLADGSDAA